MSGTRGVVTPGARSGPQWSRGPRLYPQIGFTERNVRLGPQFEEDFFSYPITISAAIAPGASAVIPLVIEDDATFQWESTTGTVILDTTTAGSVAQWTAVQATLQIMDGAPSRQLFNLAPQVANIVGSAAFPHVLPIPRRFAPRSSVQFTFVNIDTARTIEANSQIVLVGRKLFNVSENFRSTLESAPRQRQIQGDDGQQYAEDYYCNSLFVAALAAGATVQVPIQIDGDSAFEWIQSQYSALINSTTGAMAAGPTLFGQVRDSMAQRELFAISPLIVGPPAQVSNWAGTGLQPFILPQPRLFAAKSQIIVTLFNYGTQTTNNISITFEGRKIWELN